MIQKNRIHYVQYSEFNLYIYAIKYNKQTLIQNNLLLDDPLWYKRIESNNTVLRSSLQLTNEEESTAILNSDSDAEMATPSNDWFKNLEKFNRTPNLIPQSKSIRRSKVNPDPSAGIKFIN